MDHANDLDMQAAENKAVLLLRRATAQTSTLRQAFRLCVSRRMDAEEWRLLEHTVATFLERHLESAHERPAHWFAQADRTLVLQVSQLLRRMAPQSNRARQYSRGAESLSVNARGWSAVLGELQASHCRHAALVWMALWHSADIPSVTAEQARKCLYHAFNVTPADNPGADNPGAEEAVPRWYGAPRRFAASLLKRA